MGVWESQKQRMLLSAVIDGAGRQSGSSEVGVCVAGLRDAGMVDGAVGCRAMCWGTTGCAAASRCCEPSRAQQSLAEPGEAWQSLAEPGRALTGHGRAQQSLAEPSSTECCVALQRGPWSAPALPLGLIGRQSVLHRHHVG